MSDRYRTTFFSLVLFTLFDWISKLIILLCYKNSPSTPVLYSSTWGKFFFCICPTFNEGAAFGLFAEYKFVLLALRLVIISGILAYLFLKNRALSASTRLALLLIVSGAIGNVGDILFHKHVIDFISVGYRSWSFPTFNFADLFISLGTLIFVFKLYFPTKQKLKHR